MPRPSAKPLFTIHPDRCPLVLTDIPRGYHRPYVLIAGRVPLPGSAYFLTPNSTKFSPVLLWNTLTPQPFNAGNAGVAARRPSTTSERCDAARKLAHTPCAVK